MRIVFNKNPIIIGKSIEAPSENLIKNTLSLRQCSVEDALRYGGEVTKAAIGAMDLRNDRKYIVVDTKIHLLLPGFYPAIPGWHTDGVPRGGEGNPASAGLPNMAWQEVTDKRPPRYHLLVVGESSLTEFINEKIELNIDETPSADLYKKMSQDINKLLIENRTVATPIP